MIALRKRHKALMRRRFLTGKPVEGRTLADITWQGETIDSGPAWDDPKAAVLIFTLAGRDPGEPDLHIALNMSNEDKTIELPVIPNSYWKLAVDTAKQAPHDIVLPELQKPVGSAHYKSTAQSIMVFENTGEI
jgi:glycogen operon protein